ncbi:MAG TPA: hypothetical protein VND93_19945 [Myxococcales bacterium]|nr:hypothetical protein [Myxococcales bacterium]
MRRIEVRARAGSWVVRVEAEDGTSFQNAYPSERQARYFAAVYRLQRECLRAERRVRGRSDQLAGARKARAAPRIRA